MNFADLEVFKSVVDEGGVIRAASKLHRVPSAVTTRIKQLEASMGVKLFHRDKQRLHLSPAGELLLGYAERLIQLSEEARDVVSGTAPRGAFKLGALESTTASRLPPILAGFHARYPDVRLELSTGTNDSLLGLLAERKLDAAFMAEPPGGQSFEHIPVFQERLTLISSADHRPITRPRDVEGLSLIAFPEGCAYRRVLLRWLGANSLARFRVLDLPSYHAIVACVTAGAGIALVPESVLDAMPQVKVRLNPIPKAQSQITTPLVWRRGEISTSVLALRTLLASLPKQRQAA
ncbi:MAG TPA: LysR family transcriptional regulator [Bradyrhizobium sp.]|uniref:LysR family transcriptional regulator n=1 Tax=Bradyrhizobium sp. TaxID=376 RepID=UPI002CBEA7C5|nr:LysR family transcriptional regulator [Bradyrhizobium sp.]HLZ02983.1 LysR family transcriptional regulator [Bradyrhizobium sp.]